MKRDKKLVQTQILISIAMAIMTVGALIAALGGIGFPLGWIILVAGGGFFIWGLVEFSRI